MNPPKHRWSRFGLRTMFVVVTAAAIALGWVVYSFNWIRQRREAIESGEVGMTTVMRVAMPDGTLGYDYPEPPWSLRLFGERPVGVDSLSLGASVTDEEELRIRALFPELPVERRLPATHP